ncbi:adenosine deaminase family protein [Melanomma pulvis-pyrius CBS 109.77]|uniref:adenosine deaminase n=1 Tax=Melanomma pulvis-pyrius CBS 109.77 TaxID=1314802 RepID=A0A6A6X9K9_9PLEO|nr:adenosine deaminase family protein [Melanomma pulvis-pyrius CBS 109.77]
MTDSSTVSAAADGIFDVNDSIVREHVARKGKWIEEENALRQDYEFRQSLSPTAKQAVIIVDAIRKEEIETYWRYPGRVGRQDEERFAGMMFPKARPFIVSTELWKIIQRMPKGSLLHTHWNAMLPFDTIFEILKRTDGMVITASQSLELDLYRENATLRIAHVNNASNNNQTDTEDTPSLHSAGYVPSSQIPLSRAAREWPGGEQAFYAYLKSKVTLSPATSIRHDLGVDDVWRRFTGFFVTAGTMLLYEPVFRQFIQYLLEGLVDDGIHWVELRSDVSLANVVPLGESLPSPDPNFPWRVLSEEIEAFKGSAKGSGFWGVRVIWADRRRNDAAVVIAGMESLLARKQAFSDLFSGFDLVGQEDGKPLADWVPELLWFRNQTDRLNLSLPFFFHAGETVGTGNATDLNLFDALTLPDTRRIGHGFSLYKHPELVRHVKDNDIMIEVCPISNEVLRLSTDILHHPVSALIAQGVPTSISNDDPAIMGQDLPGLSFDFYQMIQGVESLGLGGLGALAQNSVRWSNFEDQDPEAWRRDIRLGAEGSGLKAKRLQEWNAEWEAFCGWVVEEYGRKYL